MVAPRDYCYTVFVPAEVVDIGDDVVAAAWAAACMDDFRGSRATFAVHQLERCPNTRRLHLQGYLKGASRKGMGYWKDVVPFLATAHFEPRRGTELEAIEYCEKTDSRVAGPWHFGDRPTGPGQRTDVAAYTARVAELAASGVTWREATCTLCDEFPAMHMRSMRNAELIFNARAPPPSDSDFVPREWQKDVIDIVQGPADDRTVHWFYDEIGNMGKSRLTRHLIAEHGALFLGGKLMDMAHIYAKQKSRIVIFDITRAQADYSAALYTFAEQLKNGFLCSTKYDGQMVTFKPPHVIFFANSKPDETRWSSDRCNFVDLADY